MGRSRATASSAHTLPLWELEKDARPRDFPLLDSFCDYRTLCCHLPEFWSNTCTEA